MLQPVRPLGHTLSASNRGTAGQVDTGDVITYTFSEPIDPNSIKAGWTGASTAIALTLIDSGDTIISDVNLGSIALGANYLKKSNTGAADMVLSGSTITVTITSVINEHAASDYNTIATSTMGWTPSTSATDPAGSAMSATAATESGALKQNF